MSDNKTYLLFDFLILFLKTFILTNYCRNTWMPVKHFSEVSKEIYYQLH